MTTASAPSLLLALRERTRKSHEDLENIPAMQHLISDSVTLQHYALILEGLRGLHEIIETGLGRLARSAIINESRIPALYFESSRIPDIDADLVAIQGRPGTSGIGEDFWVRREVGIPEALGLLYIREGSRLGGAVIGRHLCTHLDLSAQKGLRFFLGDDSRGVGLRWRQFCDVLGKFSGDGDAVIERAACSAQAGFEAARRIMVAHT